MQTIQEYISSKLENKTFMELSNEIGISTPMISNYRQGFYNPSLTTAIKIYKLDGSVLHPFAKESLEYEVNKHV